MCLKKNSVTYNHKRFCVQVGHFSSGEDQLPLAPQVCDLEKVQKAFRAQIPGQLVQTIPQCKTLKIVTFTHILKHKIKSNLVLDTLPKVGLQK